MSPFRGAGGEMGHFPFTERTSVCVGKCDGLGSETVGDLLPYRPTPSLSSTGSWAHPVPPKAPRRPAPSSASLDSRPAPSGGGSVWTFRERLFVDLEGVRGDSHP